MANILHVDTSPRGERSISRGLTKQFVSTWLQAHPGDTVTYRNIGHNPVPHVDEAWIAGAFSPPDQRTPALEAALKISDELIDELVAADVYVFGAPMYNFGISSVFKAYVDQIARVGRTFSITQNGFEGLLKNKKAFVITARGGSFAPGTPFAQYDFQEPYLRTLFAFIGVTDVNFIHAENLSGDETREKALTGAKEAIERLVATR
jgi:FMN-dependent NADH-azoreductase